MASRKRCGRFLAGHVPIPVTFIQGRVLSTVDGELTDIADVTQDVAADVGVTREISTIDDYALTATWAAAADGAGFTGLRYVPRFATGTGTAFAVLGDAGAHTPDGFSITSVTSLADVLSREGIRPRTIPTASEAVDDGDDSVDID